MTPSDLCTYAARHPRGELGEGKLLSAETYQLLHTPELDDYACGWVLREPTHDIPHRAYWHVVAVTSNDGDWKTAEAAAWEIVKASANQFNVKDDAERRKILPSEAFPKKSPFAAARWQQSHPQATACGSSASLEMLSVAPTEDEATAQAAGAAFFEAST